MYGTNTTTTATATATTTITSKTQSRAPQNLQLREVKSEPDGDLQHNDAEHRQTNQRPTTNLQPGSVQASSFSPQQEMLIGVKIEKLKLQQEEFLTLANEVLQKMQVTRQLLNQLQRDRVLQQQVEQPQPGSNLGQPPSWHAQDFMTIDNEIGTFDLTLDTSVDPPITSTND